MEKAEGNGREMAALAESLSAKGITRGMIVLRHAARHYDSDNPLNEPFMGLTEEGKNMAFDWGRGFPINTRLNLFSSNIGRCIETAYLIDKGYAAAGGRTRTNVIESTLSPFYVRDVRRLFEDYFNEPDFFSRWFAGNIPSDVISPPEVICRVLRGFWERRLKEESRPEDGWDIGVTHDWNLYVLRYCFFGLTYEAQQKVDYMDGVIVYREKAGYRITAPGLAPTALAADGQ